MIYYRLASSRCFYVMFGFEINQLADLLKQTDPNRNDSDSEDDQPKKNPTAHLTPATVAQQTQKTSQSIQNAVAEPPSAPISSKDIWSIDEVPTNDVQVTDEVDKRPQPEYEMHYKQRITTEDVFLQMGNKNPSSASCEDLVINIQLPETKLSDIVLDIKKSFLDCRCPKFRLALPLQHPADPDKSQAKWDKEKCVLQVTVRLLREYDDFNF